MRCKRAFHNIKFVHYCCLLFARAAAAAALVRSFDSPICLFKNIYAPRNYFSKAINLSRTPHTPSSHVLFICNCVRAAAVHAYFMYTVYIRCWRIYICNRYLCAARALMSFTNAPVESYTTRSHMAAYADSDYLHTRWHVTYSQIIFSYIDVSCIMCSAARTTLQEFIYVHANLFYNMELYFLLVGI